MKRSLFCICMSAAFLGVASTTSATGPTLTLDNPYQTGVYGQAERLYFSGTLVMPDTCKLDNAILELPGAISGSGYLFSYQWDSNFLDYYFNNVAGQDYTGVFFSFGVYGEAPGEYLYHSGGLGLDPDHSELVILCKENQTTEQMTAATYGVTIRMAGEPSVPGPAATIPMALGLAASALRRRNKK